MDRFLTILLIVFPAAINAAGTIFTEPASCTLRQFFDTGSMVCQVCGVDQIIANNSLSCICQPGFRPNTTVFEPQRCFQCGSAAGANQVISSIGTCIGCPSDTPTPIGGRCDCPPDAISIEARQTGEPLERRECLKCAKGFVPNERRDTCVSCSSATLSVELTSSCIVMASRLPECSQPSGATLPSYCLRIEDAVRNEEAALTSLTVLPSNTPIVSAYYTENQRMLIAQAHCSRARRSTSCSQLLNLCTLRGSSADLERTDRICNPTPGQLDAERIFITDLEAETKLPPISFIADKNRELSAAGNVYSYLDLRAAVFSINGTFERWANATEGFLQLCFNQKRFPDAWLGFGVNYQTSCKISARDLRSRHSTKYYQLYIVYPEKDDRMGGQIMTKKFAVPVRMTSPSNREANRLLGRFFMVDKDSLRARVLSPQDRAAEIIRYASDVTLRVRVNGTDGILPPQLIIKYSDIRMENLDSLVEIKFAVTYEASGASFDDIVKMLLISLIAVGLYVGLKLYGWFQRRGGDCDQGACLLPSIMLVIAGAGNILAIIALGVSIWYLIAYKFQNYAVFMLPSQEEGERGFVIVAIAALICKLLHALQIIVQQSTIDIFFLDWEQPKLSQVVSLATAVPATPSGTSTPAPRSSVIRNQPRQSVVAEQAKPPVREQLHPVSVWRTLFIGNEWNELQTIRRTNPIIQLFVMATLLEFAGLGNLATGDPYVETELSPNYYHSDFRRVLRFGIAGAIYILFAIAQWLFFMFIYERFVADAARNFVDLCALSNISVFILGEQRHGFYIHGRLLHGHADTNQKELADFLKSEAKDESPQGGLFGSSQRTFEIMVPLRIRNTINAYLLQIKQAVGSRQRSVRNAPGHVATDYQSLVAAQEALKFFISNEVEKNGANSTVVLRTKKTFIEHLFDIECVRSPDGMVFYEDDGRAFENVLMLGHEFTFVLLELLIFCVIDMFTFDSTIAGLATYVIGQLIIIIRANFGEKNVALKTGVDERFLI